MNAVPKITLPKLTDADRLELLRADAEPLQRIGGQLRVDRSPIGGGKTHRVLGAVAASFAGEAPMVALLAPTQTLAAQLRRGTDAHGTTAITGSWVGLGYVNPDLLENPREEYACGVYGAVKDAQAAGGQLKTACRKGDDVCYMAGTCKVYAQRFPEVVPDVVSTVHAVSLYRMEPYAKALEGTGKAHFDLTVIDESPVGTFVQNGRVKLHDLRNTVEKQLTRDKVYNMLVDGGWRPAGAPKAKISDLNLHTMRRGEAAFAAPAFRAVLTALDNAVARAVDEASEDRVSLFDLVDLDITRLFSLLDHHLISLNRPAVTPNAVSKADQARYKNAREVNEPLMELRNFLKALTECVKRFDDAGGLHAIRVRVPSGEREDAEVEFSERRLPHRKFHGTQMLLSATVQPEILDALWENPVTDDTPAVPPAPRPHETVVRVRHEGGFPMTALFDKTKTATTLKPLASDIVRYVNGLAAQFHGQGAGPYDGFLCVPKALKELLEGDEKKGIPRLISDRVAIGNFKAIEGSNDYASVRFQIILSRPQPASDALLLEAEALAGEVIENDNHFWDRLSVAEYPKDHDADRDGPIMPLQDVTHPHPMMAAVLRETTHSAVQQADRGRGSRRTEDNPLLTIFMNDVPIAHEVNRHITDRDAFHWSVLCAMQGVMPDLSATNQGVANTLCALLPEKYADTDVVKEARRGEYDDVYACPFENSWHMKFRGPDARYWSHVVVDASAYSDAVAVLRAALAEGDWQIGNKQDQPQLRSRLAAAANKETALWDK